VKRKKENRKRLVKALDKAFSRFIIERDKKCVMCGKAEILAAGHLISRACYAVRWDDRNVHVQCRGCNLLHEFRPERFTLWFLDKYGLEAYRSLCEDSKIQRKISNSDLREMTEKYGLLLRQE
jgi:hypothetical protein